MGSVIDAAEVVLVTIGAALLLSVAWLWLRRRWLSRTGGTFACSLRREPPTPGSRWVLGVARSASPRCAGPKPTWALAWPCAGTSIQVSVDVSASNSLMPMP